MGSLVKEVAEKGSHACIVHLVLIFGLYVEAYVIDKTWCKYEPNQTLDYAVNPGFIWNKTPAIKAVLIQCLTTASW